MNCEHNLCEYIKDGRCTLNDDERFDCCFDRTKLRDKTV